MLDNLNILSIGGFTGLGESNTSLHRTWALEKFGTVDRVDTTTKPYTYYIRIINRLFRLGFKIPFPDFTSINKKIIAISRAKKYDIVWVEKGLFVNKQTLVALKNSNPNTIIIGYSPDDMSQRHNQSFNFIESLPFYDYYVTTKSYILEDLKKMGAKQIIFVNNAYEEKFHFPREISAIDLDRLGGDVGFVGVWEQERANSILHLVQNGIKVRIWGGGAWIKYKDKYPNLTIESVPLMSEDYSKALTAFKISLCFLRKMNFDLQTTRTMEIPACGGFMLAERTAQHQSLFEEGVEVAFFSSDEELLQKCKEYLSNNEKRKEMALAGYQRCIKSGYSNSKTIEFIINKVYSELELKKQNFRN